jgi:exosome complex exonuclease DIS3/RRP44
MSEITAGLHKGIFHQGKLQVNRYNAFEAYVGSESIGDEIVIHGRVDMNRAFDGDVVAVELLPEDQWQGNNLGKIMEDGKCEDQSFEFRSDLYCFQKDRTNLDLYGMCGNVCVMKA